jgi:hypothetical protein
MYDSKDLEWKGNRLTVLSRGRNSPAVEIIPDAQWPGMWRVKRPDGSVTDMVNRSRARDAAKAILLGVLNARETPVAASPMRPPAKPDSDGLARLRCAISKDHLNA